MDIFLLIVAGLIVDQVATLVMGQSVHDLAPELIYRPVGVQTQPAS